MISKKLQRARDFEKKYIPYVAEELPKFHVTGGIGWINDPNGFDMSRPETLSAGSVCRRHWLRMRTMTRTAASPAVRWRCPMDGIC